MITKKLFLCSILIATTLFSTSTFAYHHSHHHQPRYKFSHHHPRAWRNVHRWEPPRSYIEVRTGSPYSRYHQHY